MFILQSRTICRWTNYYRWRRWYFECYSTRVASRVLFSSQQRKARRFRRPVHHVRSHQLLESPSLTPHRFGYTLESWINYGFYKVKSGLTAVSWRVPLGIPILFSIILMASIFFLPESPRWLINKGRIEEARLNLSKIKDVSIDDPILKAEIEGISYSLESTSTQKAKLSDMFTMGPEKLFYRFCLCMLLQFYQQMSGMSLSPFSELPHKSNTYRLEPHLRLRSCNLPTKSRPLR